MVLHGGWGEFDSFNDTWEWDGVGWARRDDGSSAPWFYDWPMAYDEARGQVILVGGFPAETHAWDGTAWTPLAPFPGHSPYGAALGFDRARGELVLHGGGDGAAFRTTWSWDGATWTQRTTTGPADT